MRTPHRLTLVITSIEAGGAERVLSELANHWAARGRKVTLITLASGRKDFYPLDSSINRLALDVLEPSRGVLHALWGNIRRILRLRRAIQESSPELVLAFTDQTNVLTLLATRGLGVPVVVSERIDPLQHRLGRFWAWARRRTYPWASVVVVQTQRVRQWASGFVRGDRLAVIPNAVSAPRAPAGGVPSIPQPAIVAMGSLVRRKGFDMLLEAFAGAAHDQPEWGLVIFGEGPDRGALEAQARALRIDDRVQMPGTVATPHQVLAQAALFVLSSRVEGFPNALLEAMSVGCAVASFDCPSGPADIITDGVDGLLVPAGDTAALSAALRRLIADPALRARLGGAARAVNRRFSREAIAAEWESVLALAIASKRTA
jgi:glycosyltransferase involved in cell wall biosynthesis